VTTSPSTAAASDPSFRTHREYRATIQTRQLLSILVRAPSNAAKAAGDSHFQKRGRGGTFASSPLGDPAGSDVESVRVERGQSGSRADAQLQRSVLDESASLPSRIENGAVRFSDATPNVYLVTRRSSRKLEHTLS
jgi:hypothetical protein